MSDERMRVGRSWGVTLVLHRPGDYEGRLIGMISPPDPASDGEARELAQEIADAFNAARDARG